MKKIYLEDVDLFSLTEVKETNNKESVLFHDETTVYKIFNDLNESKRKNKKNKIELLGNENSLPITVLPKEALVYGFLNNRFEGYTMNYINSSQTLYKFFNENKNIKLLLNILTTISMALKNIHQDSRNIVISDLHAENIIIDQNQKPYIIDIDSCKIDGIKNDAIPMALRQYLLNRYLFKSIDATITNKNSDKFCFLLMFLGLIFNKHIDRIELEEYDEKSEMIEILKDIRNLVIEIKNSTTIPEIPYFHDLVKVKINKRI